MWLVCAGSLTSIFTALVDYLVSMILGIFNVSINLIVAVFVDAMVWLFHTCMLRPLITEIYGVFILKKDIFNNDELMGLILNFCHEKLMLIGLGIIGLIAAWQLFKTFFAHFIQTEVEDGFKIACKLLIFATLIYSSKTLCVKCVGVGAEVVEALGKINTFATVTIKNGEEVIEQNLIPQKMGVKDKISGMFDVMENLNFSAFSTGGDMLGIFDIVKFVFILKIDLELLKLGIAMAEKYVTLIFMILVSPISFACGVVKSTSNILSKWISLFISSILYNIFQFLVMALLFQVTDFMTEKQIGWSFLGDWVPPTYMLKDGCTFKYICTIWAIVQLGKNAAYLIDELGFSFLGNTTTSMGTFTKGALAVAGVIGAKTINTYNKGKDLYNKSKNTPPSVLMTPGSGPLTNFGQESDVLANFSDESSALTNFSDESEPTTVYDDESTY